MFAPEPCAVATRPFLLLATMRRRDRAPAHRAALPAPCSPVHDDCSIEGDGCSFGFFLSLGALLAWLCWDQVITEAAAPKPLGRQDVRT